MQTGTGDHTWISTHAWSDNLRTVAWLMVSSVVFVGLELIAKQFIVEEGMSPFQVLWIRAVITAIAVVPLADAVAIVFVSPLFMTVIALLLPEGV